MGTSANKNENSPPSWPALSRLAGFDLTELAKRTKLPPWTIRRRIRREYDLSVRELFVKLRVEDAQVQLCLGKPVKLAAAEVGYCHTSHLDRQFKQVIGMTPREYVRLQKRT